MAFKLFRKEKRLPTILGILIITVGIGVATLLTQRVQLFFLKAEPSIIPQEIKISNLGSQSFTVSWITPDNPSAGYLKYGSSPSLGKVVLDERDQKIDALGQYTLHYVTVSGLNPKGTYYFVVVSQEKDYNNNGSPYSITTIATNYKFQTIAPTYGVILEENGKTAREGIVYVKVGSSDLVSTLIKPSGNWLISLDSLVNQNTKGPLEILPEDYEEILVRGKQKSSKAITSLDRNAPVPEITLGKDYDFRNPSPPPEKTLKINVSPLATPSFNLIQPATEAAIPGQPFFRGNGIPGKTVTIKVESTDILTGEARVDGGGNWTWQPPKDLPPGKHTVTITSTDDQGNLLTIVRNFLILASGTQVAEAATPSATPTVSSLPTPTPIRTPTPIPPTRGPIPTSSPIPTPTVKATPTPTPTPKPVPSLTLTPTPVATTSPLPEPGDLLLTLILAVSGLIFSGLGLYSLKSKAA